MNVMPTIDVVFLLDVDNTLLDNDGIERGRHLVEAFGQRSQVRYSGLFEELRAKFGVAKLPEPG